MIAVLKHELKHYFHGLSAYVFGAFLLVFVGIGALLYNLEMAYSNFEYVLGFSSIVFVVIVPIITMRVIAEERKQKTDQLLYSLPISTTEVVLGKYLALLIVYFIPLCIVGIYPLLFSFYGDVYLLTSYGSLFAFFMIGAALIAIGFFVSSLTENQAFAAGMCLVIMLFDYFSMDLVSHLSDSAFSSAAVLLIVFALLGFLIRHLTNNESLAMSISFILMVTTTVCFFIDPTVFEGLIPSIVSQLSLFDQLYIFINGVFDLTSIVYFVSVIVFFLFLSVQSLEKRRYN